MRTARGFYGHSVHQMIQEFIYSFTTSAWKRLRSIQKSGMAHIMERRPGWPFSVTVLCPVTLRQFVMLHGSCLDITSTHVAELQLLNLVCHRLIQVFLYVGRVNYFLPQIKFHCQLFAVFDKTNNQYYGFTKKSCKVKVLKVERPAKTFRTFISVFPNDSILHTFSSEGNEFCNNIKHYFSYVRACLLKRTRILSCLT